MKKILLALTVISLLIGGCANSQTIAELDYFYFDTSINIKIYDQIDDEQLTKIDEQINSELERLENKYSVTIDDSLISQVNKQQTTTIDEEFKMLLTNGIEACKATGGKYDPTSGALINLWSINNQNHLASSAEIENALQKVGCTDVQINGDQIKLPLGYQLDFGSSIKGYAADLISDMLVDNGIDSALINLGGNIQALGDKNGSPFNIGLMKPEINNELNENVATMPIADEAVVTSGINQRFFEKDGTIYHHIIDATSGYPANNGLASVTIFTDSGTAADTYSTMVFLMGLDDGYEYVQSLDGVDAIFITQDKKIYQTREFNMTLQDENYSIVEYAK